MPFFVPRLIGPDGKLLSGGRYDFFQAGTTTPKAVYDSAGISLGTSVTVDAGASKLIYFGTGAYKIIAYSSTGVQVGPPADNISSSGLGPDSTGSICVVANYDALRGMTQDYDAVVVLGRSTQNDGGEGIFYRTALTGADDDGVILLRNTTRYKRELPGYIDPLWFGVQYDTTADQAAALNASIAASVTWQIPLWIIDQVYVASDLDIVAGCSLILDGSFAANEVGPSVNFLAGSRLLRCSAAAFSVNIQPVFAKGATDSVRLSWMGGETTNDAADKLNASATDPMTAIIDTSAVYSGTVTFAANWVVDPSEGLIEFDASVPATLSIVNIDESRIARQCFKFASIATVGSVTIQNAFARPEWFGAVANGAADDAIPFYAAAKSGRVNLTTGKVYALGALWSATPTPLSIKGGSISLGTGKTLGTGVLSLDFCEIVKVDVGNWFAGTSLSATSSTFPATYTATTKSVSGCKLTGDAYFPMFDGVPKVYNAHIDTLSAQLLGTNSVGKIINAASLLPQDAKLLATNSSGGIVPASAIVDIDRLTIDQLGFGDWNVTALSGTLTLPGPLKLVYMIDNTGAVDITLPTMSDTSLPNICIMFPIAGGTVTARGVMNKPSGANLLNFNVPTLWYYDYKTSKWNWFSSNV